MTISDVSICREIDLPALNAFGRPDGSGRTHSIATIKFADHDGTRRVTLLGAHHYVGAKHWTSLSDAELTSAINDGKLVIVRR